MERTLANSERRYRVSVDASLCVASAVCARISPDLFELEDHSDTAAPKIAFVSDEATIARVREAAKNCPAWAIKLRAER